MGLAAALILSPVLTVSAAELPLETVQETQLPETVPPTEMMTEPVQTLPVTEPAAPPETTPVTQPSETTVPTEPAAEATVPETTESTEVPETTEVTESTEPIPEPTEETLPPEPDAQSCTFMSIAEAWAAPTGTEDITIRGTVVFLSGDQAVLQDSTGGIRVTFFDEPDIALGDVLEATGSRSGGFYVSDYEFVGTATLPAVETTLLDAPENVRVLIRNATLTDGYVSQNGFSLTLVATLPESALTGGRVDAYGVILDGRFYADSIIPETFSEMGSEEQHVWNYYFGQLHAHTDISDGMGSVTEAFQYAAGVEGLDFFAVTDHSNSFDNGEKGTIDTDGASISAEWAEGKAAAAAVTDETFVGIFGYEMSWPEFETLGHINTFNTPGWQTCFQPGFETLEGYYEALAAVPASISQFNHPSHAYGIFQNFSNYSPAYDEVVQLLEVGSEGSMRAYDAYTKALDKGWHLAPTNNQNNHNGSWGDVSPVRTVVLAEELTEESLYDAMRSYRVYATEDSDLIIHYTLNGHLMGSILGPTDSPVVKVSLEDPTDAAIGTVEVIADDGVVAASQTVAESTAELTMGVPAGYSYYYLRITQPDGDIAVTAPVWVDDYRDVGIGSFTCSVDQPVEGQEVLLTVEVFNREKKALTLESLEIFREGQTEPVFTASGSVDPIDSQPFEFRFTWQEPGELELTARITGAVAGYPFSAETTLTLRYQSKDTAVSATIGDVRAGNPGTTYRVRGYVTAGNANLYTTFSGMFYLQDDYGGIGVMGTVEEEIEVGTAMEVTGVLLERDGNLVLDMTDYTLTGETAYRYVPRTMTNAVAMDYAAHGGELLQVEGQVVSLTKTADGKGISRFTVQDVRGALATVVIEEEIRSGAHGINELASKVKKGRTVRVMGLLHVDEYGETVLLVRNCDEVVYVPPKADPTNPKTGDWMFSWRAFLQRLLS